MPREGDGHRRRRGVRRPVHTLWTWLTSPPDDQTNPTWNLVRRLAVIVPLAVAVLGGAALLVATITPGDDGTIGPPGATSNVDRLESSGGVAPGQLAELVVTDSTVPYDRDEWQTTWADVDNDCQSTRDEVLIRDSTAPVEFGQTGCNVVAGLWVDPWSAVPATAASDVDIDHTVPTANAHSSGGWEWTASEKHAYVNDLDNRDALRVLDDGMNSAKGAKSPDEWKPPDTTTWCAYATDWVAIKNRWSLTVTSSEHDALRSMLATC